MIFQIVYGECRFEEFEQNLAIETYKPNGILVEMAESVQRRKEIKGTLSLCSAFVKSHEKCFFFQNIFTVSQGLLNFASLLNSKDKTYLTSYSWPQLCLIGSSTKPKILSKTFFY